MPTFRFPPPRSPGATFGAFDWLPVRRAAFTARCDPVRPLPVVRAPRGPSDDVDGYGAVLSPDMLSAASPTAVRAPVCRSGPLSTVRTLPDRVSRVATGDDPDVVRTLPLALRVAAVWREPDATVRTLPLAVRAASREPDAAVRTLPLAVRTDAVSCEPDLGRGVGLTINPSSEDTTKTAAEHDGHLKLVPVAATRPTGTRNSSPHPSQLTRAVSALVRASDMRSLWRGVRGMTRPTGTVSGLGRQSLRMRGSPRFIRRTSAGPTRATVRPGRSQSPGHPPSRARSNLAPGSQSRSTPPSQPKTLDFAIPLTVRRAVTLRQKLAQASQFTHRSFSSAKAQRSTKRTTWLHSSISTDDRPEPNSTAAAPLSNTCSKT